MLDGKAVTSRGKPRVERRRKVNQTSRQNNLVETISSGIETVQTMVHQCADCGGEAE